MHFLQIFYSEQFKSVVAQLFVFVYLYFQFGVCEETRSVVLFNLAYCRSLLFHGNKSVYNKEKL